MYFKATKALCEACPFDAFTFLTNDSGGGLCWAEGLYPGENGPYACRAVKMGERISAYLGVFQDAARAAGLGDVAANVDHIGEKDVAQSLRKRAVIMENHRRDFLRLYKSKNL